MNRTDDTIFGVAARTAHGRDRLRRGIGRAMPSTFPRSSTRWWTDLDAGVALHAPAACTPRRAPGGAAAFALVGALYDGRTVRDWPGEPGGAAERARVGDALLRDLRRRDVGALASLRGEYAVAFWDGARRRLVLARDQLGQRGVFVYDAGDLLLFCSELGPLLANPAFSCELDVESAFMYLASGLPLAGRTLARGVFRVAAGHALTWEPGRTLLAQRWYTPLRRDTQRVADDQLRANIRQTLDRAISARLVDGVQAILLSGGIDSSYVAATAAALGGRRTLEAYTVEFAAPWKHNETAYARLVARGCGIRHRVVPLAPRDAAAILPEVLASPEPCSAQATVTHHRLLRAVRADGHRHLVSGLGADEVFGGYWHFLDWYFRSRTFQKRWSAPRAVDALDGLLWSPAAARAALFPGNARFFDEVALRRGLHAPFSDWHPSVQLLESYRDYRRLKPGAHAFEMMVALECDRRIPDLLLVDFESVGRAVGVRTAYPFLDVDVVGLACGLGPTSRFWFERMWRNKKTLREIVAPRLPVTVMERRPTSYDGPFALWMAEPAFARPVLARLRRSRFWDVGLVRRAWVDRLEREVAREPRRARRTLYPDQLWAVLTLSAWYDRWVEHRT